MKGYFPSKTSANGDVPPNTPTVWFSATFDVDPSPNTTWIKGMTERYVNIVKDNDGKWRINGLATGP